MRAVNRDELACAFLAMGHGTCVVIELPGGQTVLYDAGSIGSPEGASRSVASYLWSRGITRIDAIVLSHADIDHFNAIPGLLKRFSVGGIYVSPFMFDEPTGNVLGSDSQEPDFSRDAKRISAPEYLRSVIQSRAIPLHEISRPDRLPLGDPRTRLEVLHPDPRSVTDCDNANSIVLAVEYAHRRILLPGDLESPGLEAVLAGPSYDCDLLLAPHHGRATSDPMGLAIWCMPEWVIVSGERRDAHSSMADTYRQRGARVVHTAIRGAVRFTLTREGIDVEYFRSPAEGK